MTDNKPENAKSFRIPEYLWDLVGAVVGALIGGAAGAACGVGLSFALRDWIVVPVASLGGVVVGGFIGYFTGASVCLAFDLYLRVKGTRSPIPIVVGLVTGGLMLVRVLLDNEATWLVAAIGFAFFWLIGYAISCAAERILGLVKSARSRSAPRTNEESKVIP